MVGGDAVRDVLQQHRLAGARRRDDQAALSLADRDHQVHDARRQVVGRGLEVDALLRVERRQVLEEDLLARAIRRLEVDRLDLDQREVALAFLRRPDLARHRVAGVQVELADLGGGDVDVVGAGQVVVVGRAQEAEAVRQRLEHALREEQAALLGARLAGSRRSAPACACRWRRARRAAWRSCVSSVTLMSLSVESSTTGGVGGRRRLPPARPRSPARLPRPWVSPVLLSVSTVHPILRRSCRDRQGGHSKPFRGPQIPRPLGARQLVDLGGDDVPRRRPTPSQPARAPRRRTRAPDAASRRAAAPRA